MQAETQFQAVDRDKVSINEYSEKAFVVRGITKEDIAIHEQFRTIGGVFNFRLKGGAGWIFSKRHMDAVKAALGLFVFLVVMLFSGSVSAQKTIKLPTGTSFVITNWEGRDFNIAPIDHAFDLYGWILIDAYDTIYPVYQGSRGGLFTYRRNKAGEMTKYYLDDKAKAKVTRE